MSENTQPSERDLLKERANLMGLEFKSNISTDKLRKLVNEEVEPKKDSTKKVVEGTVEKTEDEIIQETTAELQKRMTKLRRVIISCNDPQMQDYDTTPYLHVSNSIVSLPRIVVPLNVEWHVPQAYYEMIRDQKCSIPVKGRDEKNRPITKRKEINRYNIQDLPDLTGEEIQELKQAQAMRDGVAKA